MAGETPTLPETCVHVSRSYLNSEITMEPSRSFSEIPDGLPKFGFLKVKSISTRPTITLGSVPRRHKPGTLAVTR
jgi:hypothetical protein